MAVTLGSTGITFPDATTQTTAATGGVTSLNGQTGAITNTTAGVIGSYFLNSAGASGQTMFGTVAGSTLVYSNSSGNPVSAGFSGTWRLLGKSLFGDSPNLYVRIS